MLRHTQHQARTSYAALAFPSRSLRLLRVRGLIDARDTCGPNQEAALPPAVALSRAKGYPMQRPTLDGRSILIVEDNPLIAMDLNLAFEHTGAELTSTNTLKHALLLVEHDGLSGAILDHALGDGDSSLLYKRLKARGIPFLIYSGYTAEAIKQGLPYISKPATHRELVAATEGLIREAEISH